MPYRFDLSKTTSFEYEVCPDIFLRNIKLRWLIYGTLERKSSKTRPTVVNFKVIFKQSNESMLFLI